MAGFQKYKGIIKYKGPVINISDIKARRFPIIELEATKGLEVISLPDCVSHPSTGDVFNIIKEPKDPAWVERLRKGDLIYLIKENSVGQVAWEWGQDCRPDYLDNLGFLGVRSNFNEDYLHRWDVRVNGRGIDNKPLILPLEGQLANIKTLDAERDRINRKFIKRFKAIENRLEQLEAAYGTLY